MVFDCVVIGGGVVGALTARELCRYGIGTALVERCNDVAMGTTKANSAIVHAGFDAMNGTLKARLNVEGNRIMGELCEKLSVPFKRIGSLVVAFSEEEKDTLSVLLERGKTNGVPELEIVDVDKLREMEPNISDEAVAALWAPTAGIVCPYELTIAATENAVSNGLEFHRNFEVVSIDHDGEVFTVTSASGESLTAKYVVNAAGVYTDKIANMIGDTSFSVTPRKGEYMINDKEVGNTVSHVIFQCPGKMGKGVLVSPTVDGNLLVGPSAVDIDDAEDLSTTAAILHDILASAQKSIPSVSTRHTITSFAGLRCFIGGDGDFLIGPSEANEKFINVAGIESPGLSAAPAIARAVADMIVEPLGAKLDPDFIETREEPVRFRNLSNEERKELIRKNPAYGRIICRCETVTEGEIIDAIKAPAGARDVDGVKRRTRAGMGRCQGGFCGSKVVEILARELGKPINEITKFGGRSDMLFGRTK